MIILSAICCALCLLSLWLFLCMSKDFYDTALMTQKEISDTQDRLYELLEEYLEDQREEQFQRKLKEIK